MHALVQIANKERLSRPRSHAPTDSERRPDPDALLARVKDDESRARRGRLKIFFGATAGVGKTYAMLEAARASAPTASTSSSATSSCTAGPKPKRCSTASSPAADAARASRHRARRVRSRRRAGAQAAAAHRRRARAREPSRARAIRSAGRTSRSCSRPASTSTRRSTCSISKA